MDALRKPPNFGRFTGMFPSMKMEHPIFYEGVLGREFLYFLEYDQTVLRYSEHPVSIPVPVTCGKPRVYWPDYLVERVNNQTLIKCLYKKHLNTPAAHKERQAIENWALTHGYDFTLITDEDLHSGHRLANLQLLWRYARQPIQEETVADTLAFVAQHGVVSFLMLTTYLAGRTPPRSTAHVVYHLLFQQILQADLDQLLTPASVIWIPSHE